MIRRGLPTSSPSANLAGRGRFRVSEEEGLLSGFKRVFVGKAAYTWLIMKSLSRTVRAGHVVV